jgi:translation elongation factor EF-Ts
MGYQEDYNKQIETLKRKKKITTDHVSAFFTRVDKQTGEPVTRQIYGIDEIIRFRNMGAWKEQESDMTAQLAKFTEVGALKQANKELDERIAQRKKEIAAKMAELASLGSMLIDEDLEDNEPVIEEITKSNVPAKKKSTAKKSPGRPKRKKKSSSSAAGQALRD